MYGQMTAGSWIYIGTQGIVQGTYECFAEIARRRHGGSLAGTITLTAGLGGMGGAQPLAVTMNGGVVLCVEVDAHRIQRRLETRYLDERPTTSTTRSRAAAPRRRTGARSASGCSATRPRSLRDAARPGLRGRHRHRPDERARPARRLRPRPPQPPRRPSGCARDDPDEYVRRSRAAMAAHCAAMVGFKDRGARSSTTATTCARRRSSAASSARSTTPASCPPTCARCSARARGRSAGSRSRATRPTSRRPTGPCSRSSPTTSGSRAGSREASEKIAFQGLPARICWLGYGERHRLGLRFNEMVRTGELNGADRDRPRPPRLRLGRLALPRDRGDGRRVRRDRRLAAAERARQHVVGRVVGERSTTAAASASAARSTPAWCAWPTAPTSPRRSSSAC